MPTQGSARWAASGDEQTQQGFSPSPDNRLAKKTHAALLRAPLLSARNEAEWAPDALLLAWDWFFLFFGGFFQSPENLRSGRGGRYGT
jgi:hypothetical protein